MSNPQLASSGYKKYELLEESNSKNLTKLVNQYIRGEWRLYGPPIVLINSSGYLTYYQAVVIYEKEKV